jgi:S-adenosylmethionine:tRNA ribosyltransferase-isomerase
VPLGTDAYNYELPPSAIAQTPASPRESARLLVATDPAGEVLHRHVWDLPELLEPGDLLVMNDTRVLPARLRLRKASGGAVEVLLLEPRGDLGGSGAGWPAGPEAGSGPAPGGPGDGAGSAGVGPVPRAVSAGGGSTGAGAAAGGSAGSAVWEALVKPGRKVPPGTRLYGGDGSVDPGRDAGRPGDAWPAGGPPTGVGRTPVVEVGDVLPDGRRLVRLLGDPDVHGTIPLPPYITEPLADPERYQTVYANRPGSVAAPTAGLHLSREVIDRCVSRGVQVATVELVVGLDTFRPITADRPEDHVMHSERYEISAETMQACRDARRVVAVGTTSVRALEAAAATGELQGRTDLFIHGDYPFKVVDVLMTNFHLPRSSLLLLLSAFCGERWRSLYELALASGYRFLSFGDAMLVARRPVAKR